MPRMYGKLAGVLQARDLSGKLIKPVRRMGGKSIEAVLMTPYAGLTLQLDPKGYFRLVAQSRAGAEIVVYEGNVHALLDSAGALEPEVIEALLRDADVRGG